MSAETLSKGKPLRSSRSGPEGRLECLRSRELYVRQENSWTLVVLESLTDIVELYRGRAVSGEIRK